MAHAAGSARSSAGSTAAPLACRRRSAAPRDGIGGGQRQHRPQPLAAGEHAVAHRLADDRGAGRRRRQIAVERGVDAGARVCRETSASDSASHGVNRARASSDRERRRRRLQLAALVEDLDAALGLLEPRVAEARQLHAALVQRQRLLERQVAFLELLDDRFELGDRGFEVLDGGVGHVSAV